MSFETLVFMTNHYLEHGYKNIIVTDLQDFRVRQIPQLFEGKNYYIMTLVVADEAELEKRIHARKEGFKNAEAALAWNRDLREREPVKNEYKIDNTHNDPAETVEKILQILERAKNQ
ncbi:MAG: Uncharacterized protein Greene041619_446 [Candidatus Peregrinibacteria bacterium Greene0416_19]|nr:MAG: Uncharacterized protein Greene041619_446 [Candidatus Peregrinibacteria bacterium Greene0416_19]